MKKFRVHYINWEGEPKETIVFSQTVDNIWYDIQTCYDDIDQLIEAYEIEETGKIRVQDEPRKVGGDSIKY